MLIAINTATYIGYKVSGILGALFSTLGVVLPSFIIIFLISLVFKQFLSLTYVFYAFRGIQVGVSFIILKAGIKMFKPLIKSAFSVVLFSVFILAFLLLAFFDIAFSSVYFILIGAIVGVFVYVFIKNKSKGGNK